MMLPKMDLRTIVTGLNLKLLSNNTLFTEEEQTALDLYQPQNTLIIYGSLAPGRSNHHEVENIKGEWAEGTVWGKVEPKGWGADMGYPGFMHVAAGKKKEIRVFVLFSDELPANWARLDEFEGEEYKRLLAAFELDNAETSIGYIYAINADKL